MTLADLCLALHRWLEREQIDLLKVQHHTLSVKGTRKK